MDAWLHEMHIHIYITIFRKFHDAILQYFNVKFHKITRSLLNFIMNIKFNGKISLY